MIALFAATVVAAASVNVALVVFAADRLSHATPTRPSLGQGNPVAGNANVPALKRAA